jgi:hypothetical protein
VASQQLSPQQARKLAALSNSYFQIAVCQPQGEPAEVLYQNERALTNLNRILVVTRLPRAGLVAPPMAEQPSIS